MSISTVALDLMQSALLSVPMDMNPKPKPPPGLNGVDSTLMGIVKWGALIVIVAVGFIGAGAVAGGHVLGHHKSSQTGIRMLLGAVAGAVIYAVIYAFLTSIAE